MHRRTVTRELDSPKLRRLRRELREKRPSAESRFLKSLARTGTPIVEPVKGDSRSSWVTYIWRGDANTRSVGISSPQTAFGEFDRLSRLPRSRIWYRTVRVRNDCMGQYRLYPNLPSILPEDFDGYLHLLDRGKPDPLNPCQFVSPRDPEFPHNPMYGATCSVLHLKDAPNHSVVVRHARTPAGAVKLYHLRSRVLKNRRRVWVYTPPSSRGRAGDAHLVIFFDGFGYVNEVSAPTILDNLLAKQRIPSTYAVFVDALDMGTRSRELTCHPEFGTFLVRELLPWSRRVLGLAFDGRHTTLAGCSYGGLCAMYSAMRYPKRFGGVISQSGSFWWAPQGAAEPNALSREFMRRPRLPLRIYMDAGRYEGHASAENGAGHLAANRHLRDVLLLKGYPVRYQTYNGGHDSYCWRQTLVDALPWVLA